MCENVTLRAAASKSHRECKGIHVWKGKRYIKTLLFHFPLYLYRIYLSRFSTYAMEHNTFSRLRRFLLDIFPLAITAIQIILTLAIKPATRDSVVYNKVVTGWGHVPCFIFTIQSPNKTNAPPPPSPPR